tara:strand:- start:15 stop:281 length:267 start_codon:yes stop_codon:yes gene_type:complete
MQEKLSPKEEVPNFKETDIVIILHADGETTFIFNEEEKASPEQMKVFMRFFICLDPSFVLKVFLLLEGLFELIEAKVKSMFSKLFDVQ